MRFVCQFLLGACVLLASLAPASGQLPDNGIWAIVNSKVITKYQVERNAAAAVDLIRRQYGGKPDYRDRVYEAYTNSLKQLIDREMIANDFESSGFKLPETIVDEYVRNRMKEMFGDRSEFIKTLKAEGKSLEQYKEEARQRIIVGALEEKNVGKATIVSPLKLERYYEQRKEEFRLPDQIKLRVIEIGISAAPTPEARRKLAEEIRAQIVGGASFSEMASVYSTGSQRAAGGDWGWADRKNLRKSMADVAFALEPKQVSQVVEDGESFFLFLVEEKRSEHYRTLADAEVRDKLEKELLLDERKRLQDRYVKRLEEKTFVRTY